MKTFAIALLATSALAWQGQWAPQPQQSWAPKPQQSWAPQPQQSWAPKPQQSWAPKPQQSWQKPQAQAPQYMKQYVPQPMIATWQRQTQQQPNMMPPRAVPHQPYHGAHDAFRYSRPQINYVPAKLNEAQYAECYFYDVYLSLLFGQLPGHPIEMRGVMEDTGYYGTASFKIKTYGEMLEHDALDPDDGDDFACPWMEPTYNPIAHPDHVETDPHGKVADVDIPDSYTPPYEFEFEKPLLQNLGWSPDSIMGRGMELKLTYDDEGTPTNYWDCCQIVHVRPPMPDPTVPSYQPHFHPAPHYAYGHGGYGGHQLIKKQIPAQPQPVIHNKW